MSLSVNIKRFKTIKINQQKYVCVEFRKKQQYSNIQTQIDDYLEINESFRWDLGNTPLNPGETLVVQLISRTRWNTDKVMGVYRLGMKTIYDDHWLPVIDMLIDDKTNQSSSVFIEMYVFYDPPGQLPGTTERRAGVGSINAITANPSGHISGNPKKPFGKQQLNLPDSITQQPTSRFGLASRQAYRLRRAFTSPETSTSQQTPSRPSMTSSQKDPISPVTPLIHTSLQSRQVIPLATPQASSQKRSTSPMPFTYTSPKSQQVITTPPMPTSRHGLASTLSRQGPPSPTLRKNSNELMPLVHGSPTAQQAIPSSTLRQDIKSPPPRSVLTSPTTKLGSTSPCAYKQVITSMPSAFHQVLMTKYATKIEKDQLPSAHKSSSSHSFQQGSHQASPRYSAQSFAVQSDGDNSDPLINEERNIAYFERSLKYKDTSIDSEDDNTESRGSKLKILGKRFFRRGRSFGETYEPASDLVPQHRSRKTTAFSSVKNLMHLGMSKNRKSSYDVEIGMLDIAAGTSTPDAATSQISVSSEAVLDIQSSPAKTTTTNRMRSLMETACSIAQKEADFQICVTIIEARQLAGVNMNPLVSVQVGENKQCTNVKQSTNCPYYNEYFVFDFHMTSASLLDKIITISVLQSRQMFRSNKLIGSIKLDVATVWNQPDRQFYHKWALLTDPDDMQSGPKGYLKCDISVIGKGDPIKVPPNSDKHDDDIEANLLVPDGVRIERQRARFIVRVHKADGLPKMNYPLVANMKKAFTGENQGLVDPYVEVSFAGMTGVTTVVNNSYSPVWDEQIIFTEMFPPLCQRIKIQLKDDLAIKHQNLNVIGTHFINLGKISNDGDKGFLPTFGPAYVHLYGSAREYSLMDQLSGLNEGMGEGIAYRGRILISIRAELMEILEYPLSTEVEIQSLPQITDSTLAKNNDFFLIASIFDATMIDKQLVDKSMSFELSIGNSGNSLDDSIEPTMMKDYLIDNIDDLKAGTGFWQSTTPASKAASSDQLYYYLPISDQKQCMQVRSIWPDHRRRMYNSNLIANIIELFEEGLVDSEIAMKNEKYDDSVQILKTTLEVTSNACASYVRHMTSAPPFGNTNLDRDRQKLCLLEMGNLVLLTKNLKALVAKHSLKARLCTARNYLNQLQHLCEDEQHSMPDVFIWLITNGKRRAYHRIPAREIIYSDVPDETGKYCAKMQTLFLKWPGKKASSSGWAIPATINVYFWLGVVKDKAHYVDGLPPGFEMTNELQTADLRQSIAPRSIYYAEKHKFQMRAYIYQARSLIGSDASGLSDPYARIIIGDLSKTTQVIDQTLSPTWDETLVFDNITLYSTIENIKADPPTVVIEIFDQDSVGKSEFIGRTLVKPFIKSLEDIRDQPPYVPALEWHDIRRGDDMAGELLATFELLELGEDTKELPALPSPRPLTEKLPIDLVNKGFILPVPRGIRPTLSKFRIEILFWGLRDLKRVHLLTVDKPRVDIECSGHILSSTVIQNAQINPNFNNSTKFIELELPDQDIYQPPLTIRVVDCRSFGRHALVGTHTINSIQKYIYTPMTKRERVIEDRKKSLIQLQNVDLRANCLIQKDVFTIGHERENMPLLPRSVAATNGPKQDRSPRRVWSLDRDRRGSHKRKASPTFDEDNGVHDWWSRYFASYNVMIEEMKENNTNKAQSDNPQPAQASTSGGISPRCAHDGTNSQASCGRDCGGAHRKIPLSPKKGKTKRSMSTLPMMTSKIKQIPKSLHAKIYPNELESVPEYEEFKEWLHTFELYRGKQTEEDADDESRVVGSFKGAIKVYKWPLPRGIDDSTIMGRNPNHGFFQGVPNNEPIHVLVRIYIVKATDLHPMDINGKADPYITLNLGSTKITDADNYVSKQLNPVFGKCYEIEATFPQDSNLTISVMDWDLVGKDELIGKTKIDLENRFYSRHRATCGLPQKYEETGYNCWKDCLKPTQILTKLCKDGKLEPPVYEQTRVKIGRTVFNMPLDDTELFSDPDNLKEQMALVVLNRWHEIPRVGCHLVKEHVETRPLYNPSKPGIEQGRLQMWVEMFPMDMPTGPPLDISPRKPKSYELRVIIWNTEDVVLEDDAFFTGEKMSDIYVKGWLKGPQDCQSTDVHFRSLTGEGNFNWRFVYPFDYLEAEEQIVLIRKATIFSWDQSESKIPARLELQVWDSDSFTSDDFLGALTLDLNRFPRGAKTAKLCTLDMLHDDGKFPTINLFKQKRVRGWWPFYAKRDTEEMELTGKVDAELHLLTQEEADRQPVGLGRSEPEPLENPSRPDSSFLWFLSPLRSMRYVLWQHHRRDFFKWGCICSTCLAAILAVFSFPGYLKLQNKLLDGCLCIMSTGFYCANCIICGQNEHFGKRLRLYKFPSDTDRCRSWLRLIGVLDLLYMSQHRLSKQNVCEKHFPPQCFNERGSLHKVALPTMGISNSPLPARHISEWPHKFGVKRNQKMQKSDETIAEDTTTSNNTEPVINYERPLMTCIETLINNGKHSVNRPAGNTISVPLLTYCSSLEKKTVFAPDKSENLFDLPLLNIESVDHEHKATENSMHSNTKDSSSKKLHVMRKPDSVDIVQHNGPTKIYNKSRAGTPICKIVHPYKTEKYTTKFCMDQHTDTVNLPHNLNLGTLNQGTNTCTIQTARTNTSFLGPITNASPASTCPITGPINEACKATTNKNPYVVSFGLNTVITTKKKRSDLASQAVPTHNTSDLIIGPNSIQATTDPNTNTVLMEHRQTTTSSVTMNTVNSLKPKIMDNITPIPMLMEHQPTTTNKVKIEDSLKPKILNFTLNPAYGHANTAELKFVQYSQHVPTVSPESPYAHISDGSMDFGLPLLKCVGTVFQAKRHITTNTEDFDNPTISIPLVKCMKILENSRTP